MAAIVGLAFATSRDVALHAMSNLRRALQSYRNSQDEKGIDLCTSLLCMTAEELRVRYEGERRRRETALLDAYDDQDESQRIDSAEAASADSRAVETLILGDSILTQSQEISFETDPICQGEAGQAAIKDVTAGADFLPLA